jgi:hypothetical protein
VFYAPGKEELAKTNPSLLGMDGMKNGSLPKPGMMVTLW